MRFLGIKVNEYKYKRITDFDTRPILTYYYGRCLRIEVKHNLSQDEVLSFVVPKDEDLLLFFLGPMEEFFMIPLIFYLPPKFIEVRDSMIIKLRYGKNGFKFLKTNG